jgi:hypothetical protein
VFPEHKGFGDALAFADVGVVLTVNVAVLELDTVVEQFEELFIDVMVTVVEPLLFSVLVVNAPLPLLIVSNAVLPVAVVAPPRL